MRTSRLLLVAPLALTSVLAPSPATAAGTCAAVWPGATSVTCPLMTCTERNTIRVTVTGFAAGIARCGGATAFCETTSVPSCSDTARTTGSGTMSCSVDPLGTQPHASAVCEVLPSPA